jgi:hypothetical protein
MCWAVEAVIIAHHLVEKTFAHKSIKGGIQPLTGSGEGGMDIIAINIELDARWHPIHRFDHRRDGVISAPFKGSGKSRLHSR